MDHLTTLRGIHLPTSLQTEENKKKVILYNKKHVIGIWKNILFVFLFWDEMSFNFITI